ncbi:DNA ligase [Pseudomonas phage phiK7A1]|uniref:DNA ligase n=1 Tax=Pseudomonas phage phiK7A1 TaxID=2759194 RepID=A0A7H0XFN9_9CAUD|nr:DNA ligase [Pseudomonas phage phiK7A1]
MIKTLYGLDKKGGFKEWTIETDAQGLLTVRHGKEGGKLQVKSEVVKVKNVGRANETTPEQQAENEALGRIKKQQDKGYRENKEDLTALPVLPMLASDYNKVGHRIWEKGQGVYGSDKLDGVRCLAKKQDGIVVLESRTGQPYDLPHVVEELQQTMADGETWDGELYLHGYALQDITSAVKRTDPAGKYAAAQRKYAHASGIEMIAEAYAELQEAIQIAELRPQLQFILFDVVTDDEFKFRLVELDKVDNRLEMAGSKFISVIDYYLVVDDDHLRNVLHPDAVRRGFEGVMLRCAMGLYESGKRSAYLQKYKTFLDSEFRVIGTLLDKEGLIVFTCANDVKDNDFEVIFGSKEQKRIWALTPDAFTDKMLTVKYQTRYKNTLLPQFPTGVAFRDYE